MCKKVIFPIICQFITLVLLFHYITEKFQICSYWEWSCVPWKFPWWPYEWLCPWEPDAPCSISCSSWWCWWWRFSFSASSWDKLWPTVPKPAAATAAEIKWPCWFGDFSFIMERSCATAILYNGKIMWDFERV